MTADGPGMLVTRMPRVDRCPNEPEARVADQRRAGIADEGDVVALVQPADELGGRAACSLWSW